MAGGACRAILGTDCFLGASVSPSIKWMIHKAQGRVQRASRGPGEKHHLRGVGGGSPSAEVQDRVGGEHTQDDEGAGHSHSHVF